MNDQTLVDVRVIKAESERRIAEVIEHEFYRIQRETGITPYDVELTLAILYGPCGDEVIMDIKVNMDMGSI